MDDKDNQEFEVSKQEAGERLDVVLARRLDLSRSQARQRVAGTQVNGVAAKASQTLKLGDKVASLEFQTTEAPKLQRSISITLPPILFEDEHLLVLNKPRGLVVHPGAGTHDGTLVDGLRAQKIPLSTLGPAERAGVVHRLDKDTSGAIIVCKSNEAHEQLAADLKARRVQKIYTALVCGVPMERGQRIERGRIEAPIERSGRNRQKMTVSPTGKMAITEYSLTRAWEKFALLEVRIFTGRTHQIRVHLAHLHHPVVGDERYGGWKRALQAAPNEAVRRAFENLEGQALHAARVAFEHPVTKSPIIVDASLPEEFSGVLAALDAT